MPEGGEAKVTEKESIRLADQALATLRRKRSAHQCIVQGGRVLVLPVDTVKGSNGLAGVFDAAIGRRDLAAAIFETAGENDSGV